MEYKTRKTLILVSAIFMALAFVSNLISFINLVVNPVVYLADYIGIFEALQAEGEIVIDLAQLQEILFKALFTFYLITMVASLVFTVLFFVCLKFDEKQFKEKRTMFIVISILQIVFVRSLVASICSLVAVFAKDKAVDKVEQNANQEAVSGSQSEAKDDMIDQINRLKKLKESGAITDEEYAKLLSNIIK